MDADGDFEVKRFDHKGWSVRILLAHKCRIALAGQQYDQAAAILLLEQEATVFIAGWDGPAES